MDFVQLDRDFVALDPSSPYSPEVLLAYRAFGRRGRKWDGVLKLRRVVVLAEASSGKSAEFRAQAELLMGAGKLGIYMPIERLAGDGFLASLSRLDRDRFEAWRRGGDPGWFFLDSIDEARIHRKDIEVALSRFEQELAESYPRANVLLSCRGTVWEGDTDLKLVDRCLPVLAENSDAEMTAYDPEELLRKPDRVQPQPPPSEPEADGPILVVALAPLNREQRTKFLAAAGVTDIDQFEKALFRRGLDGLAERPGDLRELARFWIRNGDLGDLSEMIEFAVEERLSEDDHTRVGISHVEARRGAERLAAALSLGQATDLILSEFADPDASGVDPFKVLDDWKPDDVEGLLQRGIFAPASSGRIRFYHRSAQEYLTASWFNRLQLTDAELYRIVLAEPFGVKTLPPSLKAAAAWIAGGHAGLRAHILEREPQLLLAQGDPRKLGLDERARLLRNFAQAHLAGDSSYGLIDHRALWMFADEGQGPAIREALAINKRADFRLEMLRLIEEGRITSCEDILLESALDRSASDYHRIVGVRALAGLKAITALRAIAKEALTGPPPSATLAPWLATMLFPAAIDVQQLVELIGRSKPARQYQVEGFREELLALYQSCPTDEDKLAFLDGLATLAFEPPCEEWPRISKHHATLVAKFGPTAREAIRDARRTGIRPELLRYLRATQRVADDLREDEAAIAELVQGWPELSQALFWAEALAAGENGETVTRVHDVSPDGPAFWRLSIADRAWLEETVRSGERSRQLLALDALIILAFAGDNTIPELERLRDSVAADEEMARKVTQALTPRPRTEQEIKRDDRWALIEAARKAREEETHGGWRRLRDRVQADPKKLSDPVLLAEWPGPAPLLDLTRWLAERVSGGLSAAALHGKMLDRGFGPEVAAEYRIGLKTLWRVTAPERPEVEGDGRTTTKYTILLSMAGLGLEAAENPGWAQSLRPDDALRAAGHVCLDDQGVPQWLGDLLAAHPDIVAPMVSAEIRSEWESARQYAPFLERAAHSLAPIAPLRAGLFELLAGPEPQLLERTATASNLVLRLDLTADERRRLGELSAERLLAARTSKDMEKVSAQLRLLFRINAHRATAQLISIIEEAVKAEDFGLVEALLKSSFHRHRDPAIDASRLRARELQRLLEIAYFLRGRTAVPVQPSEEEDDHDDATRDAFDDPRNELLSALLRSSDPDAYAAMLALSNDPVVGDSKLRLRELARQIAERCAERTPWREQQVRLFEQEKTAPVTTGTDLLDVVCDLIDRINWEFLHEDMSPRSIVALAGNEKQVQEWLGAELRTRSKDRFTVDREKVVASDNRPDLGIVAAAAPVEVAAEIKHGDKDWSLPELRQALRTQLAEQYLLPERRRHGVLVITNHRETRFWYDEDRKVRIKFPQLIEILQSEAKDVTSNAVGPIRIEVRGIDAAAKADIPACEL